MPHTRQGPCICMSTAVLLLTQIFLVGLIFWIAGINYLGAYWQADDHSMCPSPSHSKPKFGRFCGMFDLDVSMCSTSFRDKPTCIPVLVGLLSLTVITSFLLCFILLLWSFCSHVIYTLVVMLKWLVVPSSPWIVFSSSSGCLRNNAAMSRCLRLLCHHIIATMRYPDYIIGLSGSVHCPRAGVHISSSTSFKETSMYNTTFMWWLHL